MKNNQLGRFPWGILAGVCGVLVFYTIVGTVASYIVLSIIAGATTEGAGLFDTWYQQVLFIGDILFGAGFIASVVLYIIGKAGKRKIAEGNES